jgi:hypothetical protein
VHQPLACKWWWLGDGSPVDRPIPLASIAGRSVFRLPLAYRVLMSISLGLAFCISAAPLMEILVDDEMRWFFGLSIVLLTVFFLDFLFWSKYCLVVSPAGVEYHSPLHCIRTTWANIEAISIVGGWARPVQGLLLHEGVKPFPWLALLACFPRGDIARSIPVENFAVWHWRQSAVGREIWRYAPQLLTQSL